MVRRLCWNTCTCEWPQTWLAAAPAVAVYSCPTFRYCLLAQEKQLRECKPDKKADGSYSLQCCQMKELLMTLHKHLLAYCFMTSSNSEPVSIPLVLSYFLAAVFLDLGFFGFLFLFDDSFFSPKREIFNCCLATQTFFKSRNISLGIPIGKSTVE